MAKTNNRKAKLAANVSQNWKYEAQSSANNVISKVETVLNYKPNQSGNFQILKISMLCCRQQKKSEIITWDATRMSEKIYIQYGQSGEFTKV